MAIIVDFDNLNVLQFVILMTLCFIMVVAWSRQKTYPGFGHWTLSYIPHALAVLLLYLNGTVPDWASILLADFMLLISPVLLYQGIRQFRNKPYSAVIHFAVIGFILGAASYFTLVQPNDSLRTVIITVFSVYIVFRCGYDLYFGGEENNSWGLKFTATIFWLFCLTLILRILTPHNFPGMFPPFWADWMQALSFISTICLPIAWTFGFIMMTNDRLYHDLKLSEQKLRDLTLTDELTGLNNRRGFSLLAEQLIKTTERMNQGVSLFFIDMDGLKWINDHFGHMQGDQAIVDAANILRNTFRSSDIVARLGGDEFVAMAIETSDNNNGSDLLVSRLKDQLDIYNLQNSRPYQISISVGVSRSTPQIPYSLDELFLQADKAMYEQKQAKKD